MVHVPKSGNHIDSDIESSQVKSSQCIRFSDQIFDILNIVVLNVLLLLSVAESREND